MFKIFGKKKIKEDVVANIFVNSILNTIDQGFSEIAGIINDALNVSLAILQTKSIVDNYRHMDGMEKLKAKLEELEEVESSDDVGLLESPSDFIDRTTNGNLKNLASRHIFGEDLIDTGNKQNTVYPSSTLDELNLGEE